MQHRPAIPRSRISLQCLSLTLVSRGQQAIKSTRIKSLELINYSPLSLAIDLLCPGVYAIPPGLNGTALPLRKASLTKRAPEWDKSRRTKFGQRDTTSTTKACPLNL